MVEQLEFTSKWRNVNTLSSGTEKVTDPLGLDQKSLCVGLNPNLLALLQMEQNAPFFTGHIRRESREGMFQYRYGRKIQPKDWAII